MLFKRSAARLNLSRLKLTPHCARHGAASLAYSTGRLSLRDIQKCGRWKNPASAMTYEKSAKLTRQIARLDDAQRSRATALSSSLPNNLESRARVLKATLRSVDSWAFRNSPKSYGLEPSWKFVVVDCRSIASASPVAVQPRSRWLLQCVELR